MFETSLCDYIQGYYFSKPLPKEDFINFLYEKKGLVKEKEVIENEQMEQ
jgi:EAL domain-containing protein (putative c-di-GMP-specific phosphodiesterase class I)